MYYFFLLNLYEKKIKKQTADRVETGDENIKIT